MEGNKLPERALKPLPRETTLMKIIKIFILVAIAGAVIYAAFYTHRVILRSSKGAAEQPLEDAGAQEDKYFAFTEEIYDAIRTHYWNKVDDAYLSNLYKLAAEKISGQAQILVAGDKQGLRGMLNLITARMNEAEKKDFSLKLNQITLANLEPFGRAGLFSQKDEEALVNTVSNIDPNSDLYQALEVDKDASQEEITKNYEKKTEELKQKINDRTASSEEKSAATEKLALAKRAYETLGKSEERALYDQDKIESTVSSQTSSSSVFYVKIEKISPTSFTDFQNTVNEVDTADSKLNTLILDLRGNVGGSVDLMQWFLGPFIGPGNLAYEFYHQGEYEPFKTRMGWLPSLVRYKKVVILTDETMQSSAEVMAAALKKYNVGILLGGRTKGWGTIEKIFPLTHQIDEAEKYSIFLVHSLTLDENNQPIEGRGVEPNIDINSPGWESKLLEYYNFPSLITAIKKIL